MSIYFEATKLQRLGKKTGVNLPDKDGYYTLLAGGFNTFNNSANHYYTIEGVRKLFDEQSILMRRVRNGALRCEVNHPKQGVDMTGRRFPETTDQFVTRFMETDLNNVCGHFRKVWLDENFGKNNPEYKNPNLIALMVELKPSGAKASILKEQLENPSENTCLSIRAISDEVIVQNRRVRIVLEMYAIDLVNEGGITIASKWDSPTTESIDNPKISPETLAMLDRINAEAAKSNLAVPVNYQTMNRIVTADHGSALTTESSRELAALVLDRHFQAEHALATKPKYANW